MERRKALGQVRRRHYQLTPTPFKQPLAGAGVELSARPVTATAKAAGSIIAFIMKPPSDGLLLVANRPQHPQVLSLSGSRKGEAKLSNCKWKENVL
jgi:hypothetical protein